MKIYNYHPISHEYVGSSTADENPLVENAWLIPANATPQKPPLTSTTETAVFVNDAWQVTPDHRGTVYWLPDGSRGEINDIGVEPPVGALSKEPPAPAADRRLIAQANIDLAAGEARYRFVSSGQLIEEEYRLTLQQTKDWRSAGSLLNAVPSGIQSWMDAAGITAEAAAADIETTATAWETALLTIRQLRLAGKASVDASGDAADFNLVAEVYIKQLEAMKP